MSSTKRHRSKGGQGGSQYPMAWSERVLHEKSMQEYQYRQISDSGIASDDWQFEYRSQPDTHERWYRETLTPSIAEYSVTTADEYHENAPLATEAYLSQPDIDRYPCTFLSCSQSFGSANDRDRHFRTIHSNNGKRPYKCLREGCPASVTSWTNPEKLRAHNNKFHGPYSCSEPWCSRRFPHGFGTQNELDEHKRTEHEDVQVFRSSSSVDYSISASDSRGRGKTNPSDYAMGPDNNVNEIVTGMARTGLTTYHGHISTKDPNTTEEKFDTLYKVYAPWTFRWGLVFKTLWREPSGNSGTETSDGDSDYSITKYVRGEKFLEKIRRFIVIDARKGHCICLPILTYRGQGTLKKGVHPNDHTVVFTEQPVLARGERIIRKPIRVIPRSSRYKLDDMSRLNYAKLYTVEYNIKICPIGQVHKDSEYQLTADYNDVHPPMVPRGLPSEDIYGQTATENERQLDSGPSMPNHNDLTPTASSVVVPSQDYRTLPDSTTHKMATGLSHGSAPPYSEVEEDPYGLSTLDPNTNYYVQTTIQQMPTSAATTN